MKIPAGVCVEIDKLFLKLMGKAKNMGYPKQFSKRENQMTATM